MQIVTDKDTLLKELSKEDLQVLSLAYVYAKNLHMYGEDVTKAIHMATQNVAILDKAYQKGYYDGMNRMLAESENKGVQEMITYNEIMNMTIKEISEYCEKCELCSECEIGHIACDTVFYSRVPNEIPAELREVMQ